jgi:cell division transport system permease protein
MALPGTATSLKLLPDGRESAGILPWVIGVMVYLCALALAGGIGLRAAASGWTADLAQTITVQINVPDAAERNRQAALVRNALEGQPGVASVRQLGPKEMAGLLEPWLGAGNLSADLPVPALLDVKLTDSSAGVIQAIEQRAKAASAAASVDTHQQWLGQLSRFTGSVEWTANLVVLLVALATMAIVAFGTRAGLATHRPTIEILHAMGAEDQLIAREFQGRYLIHGLKGGLIGLVAALGTIFLIGTLAHRIGDGLIGSVVLPWTAWVVLGVLPILAGLLTMATARWTVLRALRETL